MRTLSRTIAALPSACLLILATQFALVFEVSAGSTSLSSPGPRSTIQIASENSVVTDGSNNLPASVLDNQNAGGILGSAVRSATDEDMGRIVDIIVDRTGIPRAAIIDFGGFLGVGSRKIAIDWNAMRFGGLNRITLDLTRDQVNAAPQYQAGKPIVVLGASPEFARSRVTERMPER